MAGDVMGPGTEMMVRNANDDDALMVQLSSAQLRYISNTDFVPPGLRNNEPAILACIATGRSLGISDMTALRSIHIIDGKPTFSAELMVQLVRRRGHSIQGEVGDGSATVTGVRADTGDEMTSTWTFAMAERAGLSGKGNWKKYPEAMLWARAVSQLCRMLFADCFAGGTYTPDELEHDVPAEFEEIEGSGPALAAAGSDAVGEPVAGATTAGVPSESTVSEESASTDVPPSPTVPQLKKLNVLVGQLRDEHKAITTAQLWTAVGRVTVKSDDGELHWSPLRDSLTKDEASALIERLQKFQDGLPKAEAA